jgi:hypothetical protein
MAGQSSGAPAGLALLLMLHGAAVAAAEPSAVEWGLTGGVRHRSLTERSEEGTRLLSERGPMAQLRLTARVDAPRWPVLAVGAAVASGSLDYDGQTQAGQPLSVSSRHRESELSIDGRALNLASGEFWAGVKSLHARREIGASAIAGGLAETSSLLLPGVQWRSPALMARAGAGDERAVACGLARERPAPADGRLPGFLRPFLAAWRTPPAGIARGGSFHLRRLALGARMEPFAPKRQPGRGPVSKRRARGRGHSAEDDDQ